MQGLRFEIKNEYGKQLSDILIDIVDPTWYWSIGPGEAYKPGGLSKDNKNPAMLEELFSSTGMNGDAFLKHISTGEYYVIFADLKAFPNRESMVDIHSYEDFSNSSCQLSLLVVDSVYVYLVVKDQKLLERFLQRVEMNGYTNCTRLSKEHKTASIWG